MDESYQRSVLERILKVDLLKTSIIYALVTGDSDNFYLRWKVSFRTQNTNKTVKKGYFNELPLKVKYTLKISYWKHLITPN